jgi:hypothetical protein
VFRTRFRPLGTIAPTRCGAILDNCSLICFAASREAPLSGQVRSSGCNDHTFQCRFKTPTVGQPYMRSWSKRIAWLCLLLTLSAAYSLVAHHHSSSIDAAKCTVCVANHSASPVTTARLPKAVFVQLHRISTGEPVSAKQRLIRFALFVRPPPEN